MRNIFKKTFKEFYEDFDKYEGAEDEEDDELLNAFEEQIVKFISSFKFSNYMFKAYEREMMDQFDYAEELGNQDNYDDDDSDWQLK